MATSKRYVSPNERKNEDVSRVSATSKNYQAQGVVKPTDQSFQEGSILGGLKQEMNMSKVSNMTQFANYLYVPCPTHPDLFITNLCCDVVFESLYVAMYRTSLPRMHHHAS